MRCHANLDRDYRGRLVAAAALIVVFSLYYVYYYTDTSVALALCIVAAFVYSIPVNWSIIRKLLGIAESIMEKREK